MLVQINEEEREDSQTGLKANNVLLDVVCFPPHSKESSRYEDLIYYFTVKDCVHLENKPLEPFKEGQLCTQCFKGRLQFPRTEEIYEEDGYKRKVVFWECNRCCFMTSILILSFLFISVNIVYY